MIASAKFRFPHWSGINIHIPLEIKLLQQHPQLARLNREYE